MNHLQNVISVTDFVALLQHQPNPTVIDVRTHAEVNTESFEGSIHLPLQVFDSKTFTECLNKNGCRAEEIVYLLCGSGQRARKAIECLEGGSSNPLIVIEGGINAMRGGGVNLIKGSGSVISLERQVRIAAGSMIVLGIMTGGLINPIFYGLSALVGAGLIFAGVTDSCAMGMLLARMPWNKTV
jgi:rhodanese-related sulfurtransferase